MVTAERLSTADGTSLNIAAKGVILPGYSATIVAQFTTARAPVVVLIAITNAWELFSGFFKACNRLRFFQGIYARDVHFNAIVQDAIRFHRSLGVHAGFVVDSKNASKSAASSWPQSSRKLRVLASSRAPTGSRSR